MPDLLVQYGLIARRVSTNQRNKIVDILEPAIVGRAAPECVIDIMDELNIESLLGVGGGNGLIKGIHLFRGIGQLVTMQRIFGRFDDRHQHGGENQRKTDQRTP